MIGSQKVVPALLALIERPGQSQTEPAPGELRAAVINTLGWLYSPIAVAPLIARLEDQSELTSVRARAGEALGMIGDSRAFSPLLAALRDEVAVEVRHSAAYALGQLGDERAIGALEEMVAHDDGEVAHYGEEYGKIRVCAAEAIETIRGGGG
jgi:HEAT repeat protein